MTETEAEIAEDTRVEAVELEVTIQQQYDAIEGITVVTSLQYSPCHQSLPCSSRTVMNCYSFFSCFNISKNINTNVFY